MKRDTFYKAAQINDQITQYEQIKGMAAAVRMEGWGLKLVITGNDDGFELPDGLKVSMISGLILACDQNIKDLTRQLELL